jgi:hypothetical protein
MHYLNPMNKMGEYSNYITSNITVGKLNEIDNWINSNMPELISDYIDTRYMEDMDYKEKMEQIAYSVPQTSRALEQLNLELKLKQLKTK